MWRTRRTIPKLAGARLFVAWASLGVALLIPHFGHSEEIDKAATSGEWEPLAQIKSAFLHSVLGSVDLAVYKLPIKEGWPAGPFEVLAKDRFLFIDHCGEVYFVRGRKALEIKKTGQTIGSGGSDGEPKLNCTADLGVRGMLLNGDSLFVSYTTTDGDRPGYVRLVVVEYAIADETLLFQKTAFSTSPPIKIPPTDGCQVGGTMAIKPDGTLFLAVGDFKLADSEDRHGPDIVRDETTPIGKVMAIDPATGTARVYASGLRSPTGGLLYDAGRDQLWEAEHGPTGGDEVNLILPGKNYGWPAVSYGMPDYPGAEIAFPGTRYNSHEGYEKPKLVFEPSVGLGRLAEYPVSGQIEAFHGGLFVSGMRKRTVYRLRREDDEIRYAEPVLEDYRVRDIHIADDGTFFMKTDDDEFLIGAREN